MKGLAINYKLVKSKKSEAIKAISYTLCKGKNSKRLAISKTLKLKRRRLAKHYKLKLKQLPES